MTPQDDPPRDPWLSHALRHAPDADATPPAEVSEAILRAARNATKAPHAAAPPRVNPILQLWSWLARPQVAAGFATVAVATVVGMMWWGRPLDESLPRAEPPAAVAQRSSPPAVSAVPETRRDEAPAAAREAPAAERPAPPSRPTPKRERAVPEASAVGKLEAARDKPVADAATSSAAPAAAPPAAAPAPAPPPAREESAEMRVAPRQSLAKAAAPPPTAGLAQRRSGVETTTPSIDQPERWTWQRGGGTQPMTPALQRWLAQLDSSARWQPARGAVPSTDTTTLQLRRDDGSQTTIVLTADAVWLVPPRGTPVTAALTPDAAAALKAALLDATP